MSLITSVAEAEALQRKLVGTEGRSDSSGSGFRNVLRDSLGSISEDMDAIFEEAAAKFNLPANLIKAVAKAESDFNPKAVSRAGAMGVMQLMPGTAKSLGVTDPYDARQNIMGGAKYLKENLDCSGAGRLQCRTKQCQEIWRHPALQRDTKLCEKGHILSEWNSDICQ